MNMAVVRHVSTKSTKAALAPHNENCMRANVCLKNDAAWLQHIYAMGAKHTKALRETHFQKAVQPET